MDKKFLTYDEQINKLISKGIIIKNKDFAIKCLKENSYFSLISGYKDAFRNKKTKVYNKNVKFEDIYYLYKLDENLRNLFFKYILKIEKNLKSHYSYFFCQEFGDEQKEYLNSNNFNYQNYQNEVDDLIEILKDYNKSNKYDYITYNRKTYNNIPFWILINCLTFGNLSKMYEYSNIKIKINIAKEFNIHNSQLESILKIMTKFRNVCAHNQRLYNYKTKNLNNRKNCIKNLTIHKIKNLNNIGKNDLFAIAICFKYLLKYDEFNIFLNELNNILLDYKVNCSNLLKILKCMGFPDDWYNILK